MSKPETIQRERPEIIPPIPLKVESTGLDFGFLADLALKTVYADANCTTERAADKLKLAMPVVEELLQHLYREKFLEVRGLISYGNNRYGMLDRGWQRAQHLLGLNGYIGPAPVSLSDYTYSVLRAKRGARYRSNLPACATRWPTWCYRKAACKPSAWWPAPDGVCS